MTCHCHSGLGGVSVALYTIPDGAAGTRETLKHMRELIRASKLNPRLRHLTQAIIRHCRPKNWLQEIGAIFDFVRQHVRYGLDTNGLEVIQDAERTLTLGYGDCDDLVIATATLLELAGHPCFLVAMAFEDCENFQHVCLWVSGAGELEVIALDPSEARPMGWFPPGARALMVAEIEEGSI